MSYEPKTYRKDGGNEQVIADGGKFTVESGGEAAVESGGSLDIESGGTLKIAGVQVTASAAQLNSVSSAITVANKTGGDLDKGTLVYISGYDTTLGAPSITAADATHAATHVLTEDIANDASGVADEEATVTGIDTSGASAVGDLVYLAAAGAFGYSALSTADSIAQVVGVVITKNATTGSVKFFPGFSYKSVIGTSGLQADSVTNTILNNMTRGTVKVGGADDAPTDLDAKTDGQILIGNGTDLVSVAVSGDVSIANTGEVTIANDAVDKDKIAADVAGDGLAQNVDGSLEVNVDDSTIEIDTDTLRVKDEGITAAKLASGVTIAALQAAGVAAFHAVDHADSSPVTIVAANGSGEGAREVLILAVASEAAAGGPEIDIGETDTINKFIDDVGAGAWAEGDKFVAAGTLTEEKALIATITTAGTGGALDILVLTFPAN